MTTIIRFHPCEEMNWLIGDGFVARVFRAVSETNDGGDAERRGR